MRKGTREKAHSIGGAHPTVVYTFPVGLGRFDWKTPMGVWTIRDKTHNPTWVVPDDIYQEHLERDGEAEHVVAGGDPDNPLGHYRLELTLPSTRCTAPTCRGASGWKSATDACGFIPRTSNVSSTRRPSARPGRFVYQPVKFGWRGDALYVEVHDDLYGMYPGLWRHAHKPARRARALIEQCRHAEA